MQRVEPKQAPEQVVQQAREVVQLYRTPGLSESATKTLLHKVHVSAIEHLFWSA